MLARTYALVDKKVDALIDYDEMLPSRAIWEATIKTLESLELRAKPITVDDVAIFN